MATSATQLVDAILDDAGQAHPDIEYTIMLARENALLLDKDASRLHRTVNGRDGYYAGHVYRDTLVNDFGGMLAHLIIVARRRLRRRHQLLRGPPHRNLRRHLPTRTAAARGVDGVQPLWSASERGQPVWMTLDSTQPADRDPFGDDPLGLVVAGQNDVGDER